jgi:hypothetical protein
VRSTTRMPGAQPLPGALAASRDGTAPGAPARPRVASAPDSSAPTTTATIVALPGEAWCVIPGAHPARASVHAARGLIRALAAALDVSLDVPLADTRTPPRD